MAVLMCTHMLLPCVIGLTWSRWTCVVSPGRWISCYILVSLLHWCIDLYTHADRQQRAFEHISKSAHMRMVVGGLLSTITAQCGSLSSAHLSCYSNTTTLLWHHTLCNTQVPHHKMSDSMSFSNVFPQQCQLSFYTSWEKSLDQNILDIELLMQIQQLWFCSKTSHDHSLHSNEPLQYQTYRCLVMDMRQDGGASIDWMEQHA